MPRGLAGRLRVHRVIAACDCGQIIHPGIVEQQITGSIVGGLSAMFHERITLENGAVKQANFHDYPLLRIDEAPAVEVHIVPSTVARGLSPIIMLGDGRRVLVRHAPPSRRPLA